MVMDASDQTSSCVVLRSIYPYRPVSPYKLKHVAFENVIVTGSKF